MNFRCAGREDAGHPASVELQGMGADDDRVVALQLDCGHAGGARIGDGYPVNARFRIAKFTFQTQVIVKFITQDAGNKKTRIKIAL